MSGRPKPTTMCEPEDFLDAIRLATEASTNSRRVQSVIEDILVRAPHGRRGAEPVRILVDAIHNVMPERS